VLVIGGGPAGLAAAYRAREAGAERVLVVERNTELGGILPQCIHNGFGVDIFGSDLTGPEYISRWIRMAEDAGVEFLIKTMVLSVAVDLRTLATNGSEGLVEVRPRAVVLAMGCRERPRGALAIPGSRPAGVYTAGTAQRLVNMEGYMPGERFVILGSGDIGMIMARRVTLEGGRVEAMVEILPYVSGLRRNLVQCIHDFDIPLQLCTTVSQVRGKDRVEAVEISGVDEGWQPIPGTEQEIPCDTLLLSVGLIPENELSRIAGVRIDPVTGGPYVDQRCATNVRGIFAAGNVVHVYDLVDDVTKSALLAGSYAARHALRAEGESTPLQIAVKAGKNVRHVVPQHLRVDDLEETNCFLELRAREPIEEAVRVEVVAGEATVARKRLRYIRPSEMVKVELTPEMAPAILRAEQLRVDVERIN
jgi:NADPH-dependent 2,4-dienoyl-CoA reductase/sulfur reductase-like enzyme